MFICVCPKSCFNSFFPECDFVLDDTCAGLPFFIYYHYILYYIIFLLSYNFRVKSNLGIIKIVLKRNKLSS